MLFRSPEHPLVLFIDDWQWADAASLRLLDHLEVGSTLRYLLIVAAYRKDETLANPAWNETLGDLRGQSIPITTIEVENLSWEDLRLLVAAHGAGSVESLDELTTQIYHRTAGNPFFSHAVLRLLDEQDAAERRSSIRGKAAPSLLHLPDDEIGRAHV